MFTQLSTITRSLVELDQSFLKQNEYLCFNGIELGREAAAGDQNLANFAQLVPTPVLNVLCITNTSLQKALKQTVS